MTVTPLESAVSSLDRTLSGVSQKDELTDKDKLQNISDRHFGREALGTGYEIVSGLTFDALTTPLKVAPPLYAALNFGEGSVNNIIGQLIRGNKKINWGEVWSSGALGVVPWSQLQAGKKVSRFVGDAGTMKRAVTAGAGMGVTDRFIQSGINEGELPSASDITTGAIVGGAFGSVFQGASNFLTRKYGRTEIKTPNQNIEFTEAETALLNHVADVRRRTGGDSSKITETDEYTLRKLSWNMKKADGLYKDYPDFETYQANAPQLAAMAKLPRSNNDWTAFGYRKGQNPTKINQAKNNPNVSEIEEQEIADDLWEFYEKAEKWVISRLGAGWRDKPDAKRIQQVLTDHPFYWQYPVDSKIYKVVWHPGKKRFHLKSIKRDLLEDQVSSRMQKKALAKFRALRTKANKEHKELIDAKKTEVVNRYKLAEEQLHYYTTRGASYTTSEHYGYKMNDHARAVQELKNLENGEYYIEHGYMLTSEKIRNNVIDLDGRTVNDSKTYQLGNVSNQTLVFDFVNTDEKVRFRDVKNLLELITNRRYPKGHPKAGEYQYPNLVINYNPKLNGDREFIIRIEELDTLRFEGSSMSPTSILRGNSIAEFNYREEVENGIPLENLNEWLIDWLIKHGIDEDTDKYSLIPKRYSIRESKTPTETLSELRERIQEELEKQ